MSNARGTRGIKSIEDALNRIERLQKRIDNNLEKQDRARRCILRDQHMIEQIKKTINRLESKSQKVVKETLELPTEPEKEPVKNDDETKSDSWFDGEGA